MRQPLDYTRTKWNGWGAPDKSFLIADRPGLEPYLSKKLGIYFFSPVSGLTLDEISLSPTRLTEAARKDLVAIAGAANVHEDILARASHAFGRSYPELVNARRGEITHPPDAVVSPEGAREIREILAWASENDVAIVPFGGGTGLVGGVEPLRGPGQDLVITLDLRRLDKILFVDPKSQTAKIEPGIRGPVLEECLQAQGLTLGHFPQSFEYSTLGGWIATRSAGHYFNRPGRIQDLVLGLSVETPAGPLDVSGIPARSAGPELRELMVGSEGCLGIITMAEMRLQRKPEVRRILAYLLPDFEAGAKAVRELVQQDFSPAMLRLSDEEATETTIALERRPAGFSEYLRRGLGRVVLQGRGLDRPCLLLLGFQGTRRRVEHDHREASGLVEAHKAYGLGEAPGQAFARDRYAYPYLRDYLMDIGLLIETLETAVTWSGLTRLRSTVTSAITKACREFGARCCVTCQISDACPSGACLHFTLLAPVGQGDELRLWRACKLVVTEQILRGGGTLSHHYGIGSVHREWMMQEHGPLGVAALRSLKHTLDPVGILNPGKLLP